MCGRFTQTKNRKEALEALGGIELPPLFHSRHNIAPMQKVAIVRSCTPDRTDECVWGFENPRSAAPVINARSETLTERPMFAPLIAAHRCLIPADGFYEWKNRQPYYFQLPQRQLFAFAGLWHNDHCIIITRAADATMRGIHHRMPVILPSKEWGIWIEGFHSFGEPPKLTTRPVSRRVNKVANDDPACLAPADEQIDLSLFPEDG